MYLHNKSCKIEVRIEFAQSSWFKMKKYSDMEFGLPILFRSVQ